MILITYMGSHTEFSSHDKISLAVAIVLKVTLEYDSTMLKHISTTLEHNGTTIWYDGLIFDLIHKEQVEGHAIILNVIPTCSRGIPLCPRDVPLSSRG